jgi:nucleoside-diphosphate-sugar epimerase
MAELTDRRVLVTGAAGFIGSHLVRRLVAEGADVHALVRPARTPTRCDHVTEHEADITDRAAMDALAARVAPSVVFHLAAFSHVGRSWDDPDGCMRTNVDGTANLLGALGGSYDRFVATSSSDVYGNADVPFREDAPTDPRSPYARSKQAVEDLCRDHHEAHGRPIVVARPFNAYGPGQPSDRVIPDTIVRALRGEDLFLTSGEQTREFNYVADIVDGYVLLATTEGIDGEVFNLGGGREIRVKDVVIQILELLGDPIKPHFGALEHRPDEIWRMFCDPSKARSRLGWTPRYDLRDGLTETIAWYRAMEPAS